MTIDILFLAKNRLEFTRQSLSALIANTNWSLVRSLTFHDDKSTDGTLELLTKALHDPVITTKAGLSGFGPQRALGSPAAVMNWFVNHLSEEHAADVFAKIDSDVIVPSGWLDQCAAIMQAHPELDLLGIEPPASRVPHHEGMKRSPQPEFDGMIYYGPATTSGDGAVLTRRTHASNFLNSGHVGYALTDSIGGIGLMRTKCFRDRPPLQPNGSIYSGFTSWQIEHPAIIKGWCVPPLKCFLLDRLPMDPWASLSREYEAKGWQRQWSKYPTTAAPLLWEWWKPA